MFDLSKALKDEQYARNIILDLDKEIYFDDIIFVLSCIISSNIDIDLYIKSEQSDKIWLELLDEAKVTHTQEWDCCVAEAIERFDLIKYWNKNKVFKGHYSSRKEAFEISKQFLNCLTHDKECWKSLRALRSR